MPCRLINIPEDETGITPIILAVECANMDCVQELILIGADLRACDSNGNNAFHLAAKAEKPDALKVMHI